MKVPSQLPEQLSSFPFTFQEAVDAGISWRRLRHQCLLWPSRGVRVPVAANEHHLAPRIRPYTLVTDFAAASHASAFLLWGFPGFLPGSDAPLLHISRTDTVVADHLLRIPRPDFEGRSQPHATREDLEEMLDRHKGTPGIRKARVALGRARVGSDSAPETRLRPALEDAGLPKPLLNTGLVSQK